jgi:hypothetical protein
VDLDLVMDLVMLLSSSVICEGDLCGISMFLDWIDWNWIHFYGVSNMQMRL